MKTEKSNLKRFILIISILIIVAGIVVISTIGLNMGLDYSEDKNIKIYFGTQYNNEQVNQMLNDVFGSESRKVQDIEYFNDAISITVKQISDEQINTIKDNVSKEYNIDDIDEHVLINDMPSIRVMDIIKPYIIPMIITTIAILAYFGIRFRKLGVINCVILPLIALIIFELLYISFIAIIRIPFSKLVIPIALLMYIAVIVFIVWYLNNIEETKEKIQK